jgi:hypothetical protein
VKRSAFIGARQGEAAGIMEFASSGIKTTINVGMTVYKDYRIQNFVFASLISISLRIHEQRTPILTH